MKPRTRAANHSSRAGLTWRLARGVSLLALSCGLLMCERSPTAPSAENTEPPSSWPATAFDAIRPGNGWVYTHEGRGTDEYGDGLIETVGDPRAFDSLTCYPLIHQTEAEAYPDTTFLPVACPFTLAGFSMLGMRFAFQPAYRWLPDTLRRGDTISFTYEISSLREGVVYGGTRSVTLRIGDMCPSPLHTEHFGQCLEMTVEEGTTVEQRWLSPSVGTVATRLFEADSLVLTTKLVCATLSGIRQYYR